MRGGRLGSTPIIETAGRNGAPIDETIQRVAVLRGREIGAAGPSLGEVLEATGYEPADEQGGTVLTNCPFHRLATSHTQTICRLNVALVQGMAEGAGEDPDRVRFAPDMPRCCVRIDPEEGLGTPHRAPPESAAR